MTDNSFWNQLNQAEIREGVLVYFIRRVCVFLLLVLVAIGAFLLLNGISIIKTIVVSCAVVVLAAAGMLWMIMRQLSPGKIATYRLDEKSLEIISSDGAVCNCEFRETKCVEGRTVLVLFLLKGRFAIVSKRSLDEVQFRTLMSGNGVTP